MRVGPDTPARPCTDSHYWSRPDLHKLTLGNITKGNITTEDNILRHVSDAQETDLNLTSTEVKSQTIFMGGRRSDAGNVNCVDIGNQSISSIEPSLECVTQIEWTDCCTYRHSLLSRCDH